MNIPVITPLGIAGCVMVGLGLLFLLASLKIITLKSAFINTLLSLLFIFVGGILWWLELTQIQPLEPFAFPIWATPNSDRLVYNDIPVVTPLGTVGWVLLGLGIGLGLLLFFTHLKIRLIKSSFTRGLLSMITLLLGIGLLWSELTMIQPLPSVAWALNSESVIFTQPTGKRYNVIIPEQSEVIQAAQPEPVDFVGRIPGIYLIRGLPPEKPTPTPTPQGRTFQDMQEVDGERIVLDERRHVNGYEWLNDPPKITKKNFYTGREAFIPSENNHFYQDLGMVGYENDEVRYLNFKLFLNRPNAALLFQARIGTEWRRWGFDGRIPYQGDHDGVKLGEMAGLPIGEWIDIRLDLINDLRSTPGQRLTALAFSGNDGNLVYDQVTVERSESLAGWVTQKPSLDESQAVRKQSILERINSPNVQHQLELVLLSEHKDNLHSWQGGTPYVTTQIVYDGDIAFIPTGDNYFEDELGIVGDAPDEIAYVTLKIFLLREETNLVLRAKIGDLWGYQWGFDGRSDYSDTYPGETKGEKINIPTGRWVDIRVDLVEDLEAAPGDMLNGLGFFNEDGHIILDRVSILSFDPGETRQDEIESARKGRP